MVSFVVRSTVQVFGPAWLGVNGFGAQLELQPPNLTPGIAGAVTVIVAPTG